MTRSAGVFLGLVLLSSCTPSPSQSRSASSPRSTPPAASPNPSAQAREPGPLHYTTTAVAQDLVAPWSLDFAKDGSIWFTERPGRVRIIRNGQLLSASALTLNVVTASGCEDGLLGIAVKEPYVYVYYTYRGS